MRLFIDTANIDEITKANEYGFLSGVTTNPTLVAREGASFHELIRKIATMVKGPVNAEVLATDAAGMIEDGLALSAIAENVIVKIPMTGDGLKAVRALSTRGVRTNVTLVFSPAQALLASQAGAHFVSVFVGRADDVGVDGVEIIRQIADLFDRRGLSTQIIAASIRGPKQVVDAGMAGAHFTTAPFKVLMQMMTHPLTDIGLAKFMKDWSGQG
ncbi:MAG TPA: fructose-6-phosphate aldolase [Spirochaetia bacterium]